MSDWRRTTTAELIQHCVIEIGDGYRAKNAEFVEGGGLPFVRVGNVGITIELNGLDELPVEQIVKYGPKVSQPFDSLITMKGTVGRVAYVSEAVRPFVYSPQISYWRSHDVMKVHPRWLRYWLESPEFRAQASATKGATDMADYINLRDQRRMRITLPPRPVQHQVAAVLGNLDDLIENNRARIEVLEQMAQTIYREWFVRFRFPGHENSTLVDSPVGPIPEDWEVKTLGDIIDVDKGLSYKGAHLTETGTPMANLKCFQPGGGFRREGTKPYSGPFKQRHQVSPGDLIVANTDLTQAGAVIGSPALVPRKGFESGGIISHHLFAIRCAEPAKLPWLYQVFRDPRFRNYARGVASGTTVLGLRSNDLLSYEVAFPPRDAYMRFGTLATDLFRVGEELNEAQVRLAEMRDLLLPKLVTGQIDVSELDLDAVVESVA